MSVNWGEIQDDIVYEFAKRLPHDVIDFARFSCVSKSWRCSAMYHQKSFSYAPLLILAKRDNDHSISEGDNKEGIRSLYSLSTERDFSFKLPQAQGRKCWGTPYSWVFTMGLDLNINLLNPLSRAQVPLPPQHTFGHEYPNKKVPKPLCRTFVKNFALACNPSSWSTAPESNQCRQVVAIYGDICTLAMATPGDKAWTTFEGPLGTNAEDIIFYKDHFYAVSCLGELRICEINTTPPRAINFALPPEAVANFGGTFYLVEVSGDLHLVARRCTLVYEDEGENQVEDESEDEYAAIPCVFHSETQYFLVFRLDFRTRQWTEVEDLGNNALFLGTNTPFAISTSNSPELKGNCIYFTDDQVDVYEEGYCDMGIYDIGKDTIEPFYTSKDEVSEYSRPVFFMPTPL